MTSVVLSSYQRQPRGWVSLRPYRLNTIDFTQASPQTERRLNLKKMISCPLLLAIHKFIRRFPRDVMPLADVKQTGYFPQ